MVTWTKISDTSYQSVNQVALRVKARVNMAIVCDLHRMGAANKSKLEIVLMEDLLLANSTEYQNFWLHKNNVTHLLGGISTTKSLGDHF